MKMFGILTTLISCLIIVESYTIQKYPLLMPNVQPNVEELYLCTPVRVNTTKSYYIVGFEPKAEMGIVHHMILYGCQYPGSSKDVWNCGEMVMDAEEQHSPCDRGFQTMYAWARDAPKLILPEDVGFKVGKDSSIQYLVLQVHYGHKVVGGPDNSGVQLFYTEKPMPKLAGVFVLGTAGYIRPNSIEHLETSCTIYEDKKLHPFAYRVHTHQLGKVVSGYLVRTLENGLNEWTLLGKRNPLDPQMFYPILNNVTVSRGDQLAARCTMESHRNSITYIGATNKDEMCNFYMMYWVEKSEPLKKKFCFSSGAPDFYWSTVGRLNNIPAGASVLD